MNQVNPMPAPAAKAKLETPTLSAAEKKQIQASLKVLDGIADRAAAARSRKDTFVLQAEAYARGEADLATIAGALASTCSKVSDYVAEQISYACANVAELEKAKVTAIVDVYRTAIADAAAARCQALEKDERANSEEAGYSPDDFEPSHTLAGLRTLAGHKRNEVGQSFSNAWLRKML